MLVTSQSSPSDENENENVSDSKAQPNISDEHQKMVDPKTLFFNDFDGENVVSPKNTNTYDYAMDAKTVEQVNLRQMSQKYGKRRAEIQLQMSGGGGQATDRRMDTSGFDNNLPSELGNSPLAKIMISQNQKPIKVM